ncbi:MAG: transposase [Rubrobacteraceae bacterium]
MRNYDYSCAGAYFVTVCAVDQGRLFGEVSDGEMEENDYAEAVRHCWEDLPDHYPHAALDAFVIMPNHIHGIVVLTGRSPVPTDGERADDERAGFKPAPTGGAPPRHGLPEIVRALKTYSARRINALRGTPGAAVWQRGYYEHVVRDERDMERIREYIVSNPRNWQKDREYIPPHP